MALIPRDEMTVLKPASEIKTVSDTAFDDLQTAAVANVINTAANTGQKSAVFEQQLRPEVKEKLEANGYTLQVTGTAASNMTLIKWE